MLVHQRVIIKGLSNSVLFHGVICYNGESIGFIIVVNSSFDRMADDMFVIVVN